MRYRDLRGVLASSVAVMAVAVATPAVAQVRSFDIPAQSAATGIPALAKQADIQLLVSSSAVSGKAIRAVKGRMTVDEAVRRVVGDADLRIVNSDGRTFTLAPRERNRVRSALEAPVAMAAQEARAPAYDDIIVTAQKKEERIQDVPIAMSAFSAEALDAYKIESGAELLRAIPNINFSKSNFASYNFSIRGIGTKALAASTDPAVAISFNNAPLIRNRLFEQEYFDVQRVEVLRGPQGTLYGRNATGGVVNMIPNMPKYDEFDGSIRGEVGNYKTKRMTGMVNVPISDQLAIRAAGALTKRDGFDYNTYNNTKVNDRDLWSTRLSAGWNPSDSFEATLLWERFEEDDRRSRTGKQLCHRDDGPAMVGSTDISDRISARGALSQGCLPGSMYDDAAYGVPNGLSMPHIIAAQPFILGYPTSNPRAAPVRVLITPGVDPYKDLVQSRNLREIHTQIDPKFKAKNNIFQMNMKYSASENITINSQTMFTDDRYYSTQDYNRFVSNDTFNDSYGLFNLFGIANKWVEGFSPDGEVSDPQLGKSKKLLAMDMVDSKSEQFYQEFRVQSSDFEKINFNIGANYTQFSIDEDYYVFNNLFTVLSHGIINANSAGNPPNDCSIPSINYLNCAYVDYKPLENIDGDGHNYFRSRNVSKTKSLGLFGEVYYDLSSSVKVTAGLRYTHDKKVATPYATQLLLAPGPIGGGLIGKGLQRLDDITQEWRRFSGRFVVDWRPEVQFADDLLLYASYSRGYKGGGANPPPIGFNPERLVVFDNPKTFDPEGLDALEVGMKGAFLDRKLNLSVSGFYYSYDGYQISQIVDRIALNENFDSEVWGIELEASFRPVPRVRIDTSLGFLRTRIADGEKSIDVMDRTQGDPEWMVVKPFMQLSTNCIVPTRHIETILNYPSFIDRNSPATFNKLCAGNYLGDFKPGSFNSMIYGFSFDPAVDAPNGGRGFYADLGGNELPNAPRMTLSVGGQYEFDIGEWNTVLRADYYRQSSSWSRVYNTSIDRLRKWENFNLSVSLSNRERGLDFNLYIKNLFDKDSITDAFINSDDSALTTNVFTVDPRLIGFRITKSFK